MKKSIINLHMHSDKSLDGKESPEELLNQCEKFGIKITSITDHDTCDAYNDLKKTSYTGQLITGIELDAMIGDETFDILCYGFDLEQVSIWVKKQYGTVAYRQAKIFNKLIEKCKEINIQTPGYQEYESKNEYAHVALYKILMSTNQGKEFLAAYNIANAGDLYRVGTMQRDFPLYIDMHLVWPDITEVRDVIHKNGGKIFLAHPYHYGNKKVDSVLKTCTLYVDGIEISNNPESEDQVTYLYNYAKEHNLLISAGSDYHGTCHPYHNKIESYLNDKMEKEMISWIKMIQDKKI